MPESHRTFLVAFLGWVQETAARIIASGEALAGIFGDAGLKLLADLGVVEVFADHDQLVFAVAGLAPLAVVDGKTLAGQVEDVALAALVEPEDSLGPEDPRRQLVVEEVLKLPQGKGPLGIEGEGRESLDGEVIRVGMVVGVPVIVTVVV